MGINVIQDSAIGICSCVMDLVNYNVVEFLRRKTRKVLEPRELRNGREHQFCIEIAVLAGKPADIGGLSGRIKQTPVCSCCLPQQFASMCKKEEPRTSAELFANLSIVDRCEPCLAETCGEHD